MASNQLASAPRIGKTIRSIQDDVAAGAHPVIEWWHIYQTDFFTTRSELDDNSVITRPGAHIAAQAFKAAATVALIYIQVKDNGQRLPPSPTISSPASATSLEPDPDKSIHMFLAENNIWVEYDEMLADEELAQIEAEERITLVRR